MDEEVKKQQPLNPKLALAAIEAAVAESPIAGYFQGGSLQERENAVWYDFAVLPNVNGSADATFRLFTSPTVPEDPYPNIKKRAATAFEEFWTQRKENIRLASQLFKASVEAKGDYDLGYKLACVALGPEYAEDSHPETEAPQDDDE